MFTQRSVQTNVSSAFDNMVPRAARIGEGEGEIEKRGEREEEREKKREKKQNKKTQEVVAC